jgi:hypothetical protein
MCIPLRQSGWHLCDCGERYDSKDGDIRFTQDSVLKWIHHSELPEQISCWLSAGRLKARRPIVHAAARRLRSLICEGCLQARFAGGH